jgi:hypothetical protein
MFTLFSQKIKLTAPFSMSFLFIIDILSPSGEPISLQSLRCSPLAVDHYSFVGHFLAFAAISARE